MTRPRCAPATSPPGAAATRPGGATTRWPRLVRAVYLVEPGGADGRHREVRPDANAPSRPWPGPGSSSPSAAACAPIPRAVAGCSSPSSKPFPRWSCSRSTAIGAGRPGRQVRRPVRRPARAAFVAAVLDLDAIRDEILPALAERYFGGPAGLDHDLRIVRQRERGTTIWASDADAASPAWTPRPACSSCAATTRPPGPRAGPGLPGARVRRGLRAAGASRSRTARVRSTRWWPPRAGATWPSASASCCCCWPPSRWSWSRGRPRAAAGRAADAVRGRGVARAAHAGRRHPLHVREPGRRRRQGPRPGARRTARSCATRAGGWAR